MNKVSDAPQPPYNKPPIVEAVIALHFSSKIDLKALDKFAAKRKSKFPRSEDITQISATFDMLTQSSRSAAELIGKKFTSSDGASIITAQQQQFAVSHLPPYSNWESLYSEFREYWETFVKFSRNLSVSHASARYVNRIDVPVTEGGSVNLHKYFSVGLSLPEYAQVLSLEMFNISCSLLHRSGECRFILNLAAAPSPLIDHMSFFIDIDCSTTGKMPLNEEKMWDLINSLRKYKNEMFESCITDETRMLFK